MQLLHSKILGNGKPLLILHGFLGMSDNWKTLGKLFASNGLQVHLIDQRNHGRSFHHNIFNYKVLAQDIHYYVDYYRLDTVILLGHSMGGKTAMEFACSFPEKVDQLVVVDIAPKFYPQHHQTILQGLQAIDFSKIKTRQQADEKLSEYVKDLRTRQFLLKNLYWKEKGKLGFRFHLVHLIDNITHIGKPLETGKQFDKDTLFIKGENSTYITLKDEPLIRSHFPKYTLKEMPKAGHWLHAENTVLFKEWILDFIQLI